MSEGIHQDYRYQIQIHKVHNSAVLAADNRLQWRVVRDDPDSALEPTLWTLITLLDAERWAVKEDEFRDAVAGQRVDPDAVDAVPALPLRVSRLARYSR